jgi:hypothetical protein
VVKRKPAKAPELYRVRHPETHEARNARWKVTERFDLQLTGGAALQCVRVRCYHGGHAIVQRYEQGFFAQLFVAVKRSPATARKGRG